MTDETRKALTLFLGECWHEIRKMPDRQKCSCGEIYYLHGSEDMDLHIFKNRRTFATEADLMALYQKLYEVGKWEEFYYYAFSVFKPMVMRMRNSTRGQMLSSIDNPIEVQIIPWLLCLSGEGYEERCEMVASFRINERLKELARKACRSIGCSGVDPDFCNKHPEDCEIVHKIMGYP